MNTPAPAEPAPQNPAKAKGSLGFGIGLAWACLIGGYFIVAIIASVVFGATHGGNSDTGVWVVLLSCLLPWIAMLALIVWFAHHDQPRTALGVGVGIGSIVGVVLLLVAACFGLLSNTSFR